MAKLIDELSSPSTKSELDLFSVPPTQVAVKRGFWDEVHPCNPVTNEGPFEFRIPGDPCFIQMSKNYICFVILIVTLEDGKVIPPAQDIKVSTINAIGKTFFKQVKLYLNGKLVHDTGVKYSYRAFFETALNFGTDAKSSHLDSVLYVQESGVNVDTTANPGFVQRAALFQNNAWVELMSPLHIDLFEQDRYLINNVEMRIELHKQTNPFLLLNFDNNNNARREHRIEIESMKLYIRKVEILDSIGIALEKTMQQYTAKYVTRRVTMTNLHITENRRSTPLNNLFVGQIPQRLIFGCVDADAFQGVYNKSPFNFKNYSINEVKVIAGGQTFPSHPLKTNFTKGHFMRAFNQLFETLDMANNNKGNNIDRNAFANGMCLFGFDITPDEDDGGHWDLIRDGATSLEINFDANLPAGGIEVIVFAEFDNLVMIDKNRNTFCDYAA